jgi:hypothetical protein
VVLSDFLDPAGYEAGLTALVGRGFHVDIVQILAPDELSPSTFGDLRLVDSAKAFVSALHFCSSTNRCPAISDLSRRRF